MARTPLELSGNEPIRRESIAQRKYFGATIRIRSTHDFGANHANWRVPRVECVIRSLAFVAILEGA